RAGERSALASPLGTVPELPGRFGGGVERFARVESDQIGLVALHRRRVWARIRHSAELTTCSGLWARRNFLLWDSPKNRTVAMRLVPSPDSETMVPEPYCGCDTTMPWRNTSGEVRRT